jgi:ATP-dependent RNA helicase DDX58
VEQQKKMFVRYLSNLKTLGLSGDQDGKLPVVDLLLEYQVLVMTPQVMENALLAEGVVLLRSFSLMIFDECHHTTKNHPYNAIMAHYIDQSLENEERRRAVNIVPQVASYFEFSFDNYFLIFLNTSLGADSSGE